MPKSRFLNVANMSFNAIHENKIRAKISEFTVGTICMLKKVAFGAEIFACRVIMHVFRGLLFPGSSLFKKSFSNII